MHELDDPEKEGVIVLVCVLNFMFTPIATALQNANFKTVVPLYDYLEGAKNEFWMSNGWYADFTPNTEQNVREVYGRLIDDQSRASYLEMLSWHVWRKELRFEEFKIDPNDKFFAAGVVPPLGEEESIVDAGSWSGGVASKIINDSKGMFKHVACIEPDPDNFKMTEANISPFRSKGDVALFDLCVGKTEGTVSFLTGLDFASRIAPNGKSNIKSVRLDEIINFPVTYLKIHVEGHELGALEGAAGIIAAGRPIITVAGYPSSDCLWKIPLAVSELSDYQLYFRQHAFCGTGSVIYGIPKERLK